MNSVKVSHGVNLMIDQLAVSNLCWKPEDTIKILNQLNKYGVRFIELAPTKILGFKSFKDLRFAKIYKEFLQSNYDIKVVSLQSIMFNTDLEIFDTKNRRMVIRHFKDVFKFAYAIGARIVVLGSPSHRKLNNKQSPIDTVDLIQTLSSYSKTYNIKLLIEPNPIVYNSNFITSNIEALNYISNYKINDLYINLDLGSVKLNSEDLSLMSNDFFNLVKHVHISEPYLEQIRFDKNIVSSISTLKKMEFNGFISIESKELSFMDFSNMLIEMIKGLN